MQIKDRTGEFEYINIGEDVQYLKEFVRLRDKEAAFDEMQGKRISGDSVLCQGRWFCDRRAGECLDLCQDRQIKHPAPLMEKDVRLLKRVCFIVKIGVPKGGS